MRVSLPPPGIPRLLPTESPVQSAVLRASYNGHYLDFPSPSALINTTICARFHVTFSCGSTKNHCSRWNDGDASFHASTNLKKLLI